MGGCLKHVGASRARCSRPHILSRNNNRVGGCGTVVAQCVEICDGKIGIRLEPEIRALGPGKTLPLQPPIRSLPSCLPQLLLSLFILKRVGQFSVASVL
jgi:hypothetical protein